MEKRPAKSKQQLTAVTALTGWVAVILQLYLIIINRVASIAETIIRFFSFYTILTNIIVAGYLTILWLKPHSRFSNFLSHRNIAAAITLYIAVVGLIYNIILRPLWNPQGLQRVADELLHVAVPILFILYWLTFASKAGLIWKDIFRWLIYPFVYIICILFRGAISGFYPYPFVDVSALGYGRVFLNSAGLFCLFLLGSILLVTTSKVMNRNKKPVYN